VAETALDGLCPACLMRQALAGDSQAVFTSSHSAHSAHSALSASAWTLVTLVDEDEGFVTYLAQAPDAQRLARLVVQKRAVDAADLEAARVQAARRREALAKVRHPALAEVLDAGVTEDGHPFLVTPFVIARPLVDLAALAQALEALRALHAAGIVHGHVCESTILAHQTKAGATVVVTGFAPLAPSSSLSDGIQRDLQQFQALATTVQT
jgi:hypothetical protein